MPRFYFHLVTPESRETDEIGNDFDSAEVAYLQALRAASEIAADTILRGEGCIDFRFEVCDARQRLVLELPFLEILSRRVRPPVPVPDPLHARLAATVQRGVDVQAQFATALAKTRETVAMTRAILDRHS